MAQLTRVGQRLTSKPSFQRGLVALALLALMFLAGLLLIQFLRMAWLEHQINRQIEQQSSENVQQVAKNLSLKGLAEWSESDGAAEQAARERLGMARDGETVLLPTIVSPPAPPATEPEASEPLTFASLLPERDTTSNAARWVRAFFPEQPVTP